MDEGQKFNGPLVHIELLEAEHVAQLSVERTRQLLVAKPPLITAVTVYVIAPVIVAVHVNGTAPVIVVEIVNVVVNVDVIVDDVDDNARV